jgi:hypothetical protein
MRRYQNFGKHYASIHKNYDWLVDLETEHVSNNQNYQLQTEVETTD